MIQLNYGEKLRFTCSFQHRGEAYLGAKLRAAIGNKGAFGFDEIVWSVVTITGILDDINWRTYTKTVDVSITTALSPGAYEANVKLMSIPGADIYWEGPLDDIVIAGGAEPEFQSLTVTYTKA